MSQEIIKVLEYLGEKLGIAIDWTTENVLPYAEQLFKRYVILKITYSSIGTIIGIALAVTAIVLFVKLIKGYNETEETGDDNIWWEYDWGPSGLGVFATVAIIVCAFAALITLLCEVSSLIEWIIIPEVPFVKEITYLISTM